MTRLLTEGGWGGGGKEKRWILQPSVKTRKIIIQCSSSSFPSREFSFCLGKRLTVRVLLLQLILLCCKRVFFFFSFALEWATDAGEEQMECVPTRCNVQNQGHTVLLQSSWSGLLSPFRRASKREGARDYCPYNFFFFLKNPTNSSICLQRKCRCSNVGCCCLVDCSASPGSSARTQCFLYIYLYLYISIYIYASSFPVSHQ